MSTGHAADSVERQVQSTVGNADFRKGKWFCECHIAARCLTATKNSAHHGEKCMFTFNLNGPLRSFKSYANWTVQFGDVQMLKTGGAHSSSGLFMKPRQRTG